MTEKKHQPVLDLSRETYAVVGELVLISTAIDYLLNKVLISVLQLGNAPMLEPVVAALDAVRKVEILRARAKLMTETEWQKNINKFCDKVETVSRHRNMACHTPAVLQDGIWSFKPVAAAAMLKKLNLQDKTLRPFSVSDLKTAIKVGEAALGCASNLIENFDRAALVQNARNAFRDQPNIFAKK